MQLQVVTTIQTAASSYNLTTLDVVRDELDIDAADRTDDRWLLRVITQVSAAVVSYCNNKFVQETLQDVFFPNLDPFPYQVPGGIDRLQLSRWPVASVASVSTTDFNGNVSALTVGSGFDIEPDSGHLIQLDPFTGYPMLWSPMQTTVVYTAGYSPVPPDVEGCVLQMITGRYRARGRDPYLKAEDVNGAAGRRREWWVPSAPTMRGSLPEEIAAVLDPYRVPVVA